MKQDHLRYFFFFSAEEKFYLRIRVWLNKHPFNPLNPTSLIVWNWQVFRRGFSRLIKVPLGYMVNRPLKFLGLLYRNVSTWDNYKEWPFNLLHKKKKNPNGSQYCCHQMECNKNIPSCLKAQTRFVLQHSFTVLVKVDDCCCQSNN